VPAHHHGTARGRPPIDPDDGRASGHVRLTTPTVDDLYKIAHVWRRPVPDLDVRLDVARYRRTHTPHEKS
jgi:hypothetical protein